LLVPGSRVGEGNLRYEYFAFAACAATVLHSFILWSAISAIQPILGLDLFPQPTMSAPEIKTSAQAAEVDEKDTSVSVKDETKPDDKPKATLAAYWVRCVSLTL
jgi:hypothetical protein